MLIQINFFTPLSFRTKIHVELPLKVDSHNFTSHSQCSTSVSLQNWWNIFLAESEKGWFKSKLLLPLLVLDEKFTLNFPGKLTFPFYAYYSQCSTSRSLQKVMDNFQLESEKVPSQESNFFYPLSFWTKIRWTPREEVDSQFLLSTTASAVPKRAASKKLMGSTFLAWGGWKRGLIPNQASNCTSFHLRICVFTLKTSPESWLTLLRSL